MKPEMFSKRKISDDKKFELIEYLPGHSAYLHVDCRGRSVRQQ